MPRRLTLGLRRSSRIAHDLPPPLAQPAPHPRPAGGTFALADVPAQPWNGLTRRALEPLHAQLLPHWHGLAHVQRSPQAQLAAGAAAHPQEDSVQRQAF